MRFNTDAAAYLNHANQGADIWTHLAADNTLVNQAYSGFCILTYSPGSFAWPVPVVWEVGTAISATNRPVAWNQDQQFSIDSSGTVTVRKFGRSITRTTSDNISTQ